MSEDLAVYEGHLPVAEGRPTVAMIMADRKEQLVLVKEMMKLGIHYGKIPGTPKPSLWQPGAQLLNRLHGYRPTFEPIEQHQDWTGGFFHYTYRCRLISGLSGALIAEGVGACNSGEKKYREAMYHGKDEGKPVDPRDQVNTYIKMAMKRALIAATLNATGLSDLFTQDIEDMQDIFPPKAAQPQQRQATRTRQPVTPSSTPSQRAFWAAAKDLPSCQGDDGKVDKMAVHRALGFEQREGAIREWIDARVALGFPEHACWDDLRYKLEHGLQSGPVKVEPPDERPDEAGDEGETPLGQQQDELPFD